VTPDQRAFIEAELFQLTLAAVTQRAKVYRSKLTEEKRKPVHVTLRKKLFGLTSRYNVSVSDASHIATIRSLSKSISVKHADVLNGGFRIGCAQKALNLHLKYRWCLGEIPEPPHCPFDSRVLRWIPGWKSKRWTAMNSIDEYVRLAAAARIVAGAQSLAMWELAVYNSTA